jgi:hypothetical protein
MENIYHKFVFDHLSEMDPPLFFDHFKFAYAEKVSAQQLLATSLSYLQNFVNEPAINSLAREKAKELKVFFLSLIYVYLIKLYLTQCFVCCTIEMDGKSFC